MRRQADLAQRLRRLARKGWGHGVMAFHFDCHVNTLRAWMNGFSPKGTEQCEMVYSTLEVLEHAIPEPDEAPRERELRRAPGTRQLAAALLEDAITARWIPDELEQARAREFLGTPASVEFWAHMAGVDPGLIEAQNDEMGEGVAVKVIKWLRRQYDQGQAERLALFNTPEVQIAAGKLHIRRALCSEVRSGERRRLVSEAIGYGSDEDE